MKGRTPSANNKWHIPVQCYRLAVEYALNYDMWRAEIRSLRNQSQAIRYDKDKVQSSSDYNPTEAAAIKAAELQHKLDIIDEAIAKVADEDLEEYLRLHVCNGYTYWQLTNGRLHMPLNKNEFGELRQHFFYELYQSI